MLGSLNTSRSHGALALLELNTYQPPLPDDTKKNLNEHTHRRGMAAVVLEVGLSDADLHDTPRQYRRLGCGNRGARRRHVTSPIVPLQDHRAPSPQPQQALHMSGTPHFSTHTTYTNRPPRRSWLSGAQRHRATPPRCPRSTGWPRRTRKGDKTLPFASNLGDTIHT